VRGNVLAQKALVAKRCAHLRGDTPRLIEAMLAAKDFDFRALAQVRMESWSKGRVMLAGDAAYCPSPFTDKARGWRSSARSSLPRNLRAAPKTTPAPSRAARSACALSYAGIRTCFRSSAVSRSRTISSTRRRTPSTRRPHPRLKSAVASGNLSLIGTARGDEAGAPLDPKAEADAPMLRCRFGERYQCGRHGCDAKS